MEENNSIIDLISEKNYTKAREELLELNNVVDIAAQLEQLEREDLIKMFRLMPKDIASDIFSYFPKDIGRELIVSLSESEATNIIEDLFADDAADILDEMPASVVKKLLSMASEQTRKHINHLLQYPESSAGSIMTVEFVDLKKKMTVAEAIEEVRREGVDKETINNCYVLEADRRLVGTISLRKLLISSPNEIIENIMTVDVKVINTMTDQEEVATLFRKYDLTTMPVVDSENRLVGIITVDDVVDIIQSEADEDISIMAAVTPSDTPYFKTKLWRIFLNRLPWLLILMISATFTGMIITSNEEVLSKGMFGIILTASIPMLMDTGGNAANQANATIIRGMALGEISTKQALKVLWKEVRLSMLLGVSLAIVCYAKLMLIDRLYGVERGFTVALIISASLFITVVVAKIAGGIMPLVAKVLKLDPAVVASPLITTLVDAIALIIYCNIALAVLH